MFLMDQARKGRRPYSISVGQRPMKSGQTISARLKALKQFFFRLSPLQGWFGLVHVSVSSGVTRR